MIARQVFSLFDRHHRAVVRFVAKLDVNDPRARQSHIFDRETHDHYVEEPWCSKRLFDVEPFVGTIVDPACG